MQEVIVLVCTDCRRKNYYSSKNKKKNPDKLELKKYCMWCRKHTAHKEGKV